MNILRQEKLFLDTVLKLFKKQGLFAPVSRSLGWNSPTPETLIDRTLELFGAGTKIAIEVAILATDAGVIGEGEETITCAGTYKGLDTALIVRTAYSMNFFKDFEVIEIIAKPACMVKSLLESNAKTGRETWSNTIEISSLKDIIKFYFESSQNLL